MAGAQQNLFPQDDVSVTMLADSKVRFRVRANRRIRKSRLVVSPEEGLVVEMPKMPSIRRAKKLINLRKTWVLNALDCIDEKLARARIIKKHRNSVLILGKEKVVIVKRGQARAFTMETAHKIYLGFEEKHVSRDKIYARLSAWLRAKAETYLPLRVRQLNRSRFNYSSVVIKDQKTLWGSCSAEGCLSFNWHIIMAPKAQIDYIILHELCHTRYLNHSKSYWNLVDSVCPTYEASESWFRDFGFLLDLRQICLPVGGQF
jgi:predicted metal-dependent hydrolase